MSIVLTDHPEQWVYVEGPERLHRYPWRIVLGSISIARAKTKGEAADVVEHIVRTLKGPYGEREILALPPTKRRRATPKRGGSR